VRQCRVFTKSAIGGYKIMLDDHVERWKITQQWYALINSFIDTDLSQNPPPLFSNQKPLIAFIIDWLTKTIVACVHIWWSAGYSITSPLIIEFDFLPLFKEYRLELIDYSVKALIRHTTIDCDYKKLYDRRLINKDKFIMFIPVKGCTTDWKAIRQVVFDQNINHDVCAASLPKQVQSYK
jgi:hypothetical protein